MRVASDDVPPGLRRRRGDASVQSPGTDIKNISNETDANNGIPVLACLLVELLLVRIIVGCFGHSGQGQAPAVKGGVYGGDYEAQRHWMELTLHLPVGEWYRYDLQYWGLDYPPLTAYVSWVCGAVSRILDPASVELFTSRGYETVSHKVYMRLTVLFLDFAIYFTGSWALSCRLSPDDKRRRRTVGLLTLLQPAIILVDHGHFQYNSVSLGLTFWAFFFFTCPTSVRVGINEMLGSVFFCLALNFKQMSLYHAPAVFCFLLGRCLASGSFLSSLAAVSRLGVAVILTFGVLWSPFCVHAAPEVGCVGGLLQILIRLFPFNRGLFEDKVANLWFALSVKPLSIRSRLPVSIMPRLALIATLVLIAVPCWRLLRSQWSGTLRRDGGLRLLLWGATTSALAFFLASFQVHEKSLLLAICPFSLLVLDRPLLVSWSIVAGTWTMFPLLHRDGQVVPYLFTLALYCVVCACTIDREQGKTRSSAPLLRLVIYASSLAMVCLHVASHCVTPPPSMPDLWPVLWALGGFVMVSYWYIVVVWCSVEDV